MTEKQTTNEFDNKRKMRIVSNFEYLARQLNKSAAVTGNVKQN